MPRRGYSMGDSRKYIQNKQYTEALLRTAADLETLLFEKLFFEKKIEPSLIANWTLGGYIKWNLKLGLIASKHTTMLKEFKNLRNNFVHQRTFMEKLQKNKSALERTTKLLLKVIEFIESTQIEYEWDMELEKKYSNLSEKQVTI